MRPLLESWKLSRESDLSWSGFERSNLREKFPRQVYCVGFCGYTASKLWVIVSTPHSQAQTEPGRKLLKMRNIEHC